jgi:hypothetical protein
MSKKKILTCLSFLTVTGTKLSNIQLPLRCETHLRQTSKLQVEEDEAERNKNNVTHLAGVIYSFYKLLQLAICWVYCTRNTQTDCSFISLYAKENGIPFFVFLAKFVVVKHNKAAGIVKKMH